MVSWYCMLTRWVCRSDIQVSTNHLHYPFRNPQHLSGVDHQLCIITQYSHQIASDSHSHLLFPLLSYHSHFTHIHLAICLFRSLFTHRKTRPRLHGRLVCILHYPEVDFLTPENSFNPPAPPSPPVYPHDNSNAPSGRSPHAITPPLSHHIACIHQTHPDAQNDPPADV